MTAVASVRVVISLGAIRSRLARFVTGSMVVHGVLVAAILIVPATRRRAMPIDDSMVVSLAGPLVAPAPPSSGATAPVAAKPAPAAPAPPPPPKEAQAVKEVPVKKPKEIPKPTPKPEPERPAETPAATPPPGPPTPPGPPGGTAGRPGAPQGSGATGVTASVGSGDSSLGWYGAAVKAALESVWVKPYLEDVQGVASVVVSFDIARDGATRNFRIVQSSGIPSLDRSAQRAVIEASPLPAVPPQWTEPTIPVTMRFELSAGAL